MSIHRRSPMPPMNLHMRILGRPVKPVAFTMAYTMLIIAWAAATDRGVLDGSNWADILSGGALATTFVFVIGWYHNSQRLAELGLLMAFFIWMTRFYFVLLVRGSDSLLGEGLWFNLGWAAIAGGSYLLERTDQRRYRAG